MQSIEQQWISSGRENKIRLARNNVARHTYLVTLCTGTTRNERRFIRRSSVFSICDTRKNIRSNSFSFSSWLSMSEADAWRMQYRSKTSIFDNRHWWKSSPMLTLTKSWW